MFLLCLWCIYNIFYVDFIFFWEYNEKISFYHYDKEKNILNMDTSKYVPDFDFYVHCIASYTSDEI